jgi:hypothetical protein
MKHKNRGFEEMKEARNLGPKYFALKHFYFTEEDLKEAIKDLDKFREVLKRGLEK